MVLVLTGRGSRGSRRRAAHIFILCTCIIVRGDLFGDRGVRHFIPRVADIDLFHVSERMTRQKRRAARYSVSGKRRNAAGRARGSTEGREKFLTGGVAPPLWYRYHGANRSYPVTNFSRPSVCLSARPAALRRLADTLYRAARRFWRVTRSDT